MIHLTRATHRPAACSYPHIVFFFLNLGSHRAIQRSIGSIRQPGELTAAPAQPTASSLHTQGMRTIQCLPSSPTQGPSVCSSMHHAPPPLLHPNKPDPLPHCLPTAWRAMSRISGDICGQSQVVRRRRNAPCCMFTSVCMQPSMVSGTTGSTTSSCCQLPASIPLDPSQEVACSITPAGILHHCPDPAPPQHHSSSAATSAML